MPGGVMRIPSLPTRRRSFLKQSIAAGVGCILAPAVTPRLTAASGPPLFKISLAEWSLHKALFGRKLDHLDFPRTAIRDYGISAVELVNQFFRKKAKDQAYLREFKTRADGEG